MIKNNHWSEYWQTGVQTSLPADFKKNYDGEIFDFWRQCVIELEINAKVVDVCTGNGAVALIIAEVAQRYNQQLSITAVDISDINVDSIQVNNPTEITDLIQFVSHCPVETLDQFIREPQDLIVSQYGIEYSDLRKTAKTLSKILVPNGQLIFIAHSPKSAVFKFMEQEELIYVWLSEVGILSLFDKFTKEQLTADDFKKKLLNILQHHNPNPAFKSEPLFLSWLKMIAHLRTLNSSQLKAQKEQLAEFSEQHQFARLRANDMLKVAEKVADNDWLKPLYLQGFELETKKELYYQSKHLIGDCFVFRLKTD